MATSQDIPYWMTDAYKSTQPGAMSGTMSQSDAEAEYEKQLAALTARNKSQSALPSLHLSATSGQMGGLGPSMDGLESLMPSPAPPPMAPSAGAATAPPPVELPQLAQEAPEVPAPRPSMMAFGGGGGEATPPGQIIAPGSMREGIGRRVPPSLAALLKPKVY